MFRMSKMTDYGLVLLTELAQEEGSTRTARELAEATRVPLPSVSKVLKGLQGAGLLVSHRGSLGGYGLARPAAAIPLTLVITTLEGPVGITECVQHTGIEPSCELESVCRVRGHWRIINQAIHDALGRLTVADLCAPTPRVERLVGLNAPPRPATGGISS
jgi:FeS assembly SUF system regulator